jgi:hypothetical protein
LKSLAPIPESEEESLYTEEDKEDLKEKKMNETFVAKSDQLSTELIPNKKPASEPPNVKVPPSLPSKPASEPPKAEAPPSQPSKPTSEPAKVEVPRSLPSKPQGLETVQKPKGHSRLDYSKWDKVEDDSSEDDEDDDEDEMPQYKFKVRTIGVRSVK